MSKPKSTFDDAARTFAEAVRVRLPRTVDAQPEDQLKGPVQALLRSAGQPSGVKVDTRTEVRVSELGGRPDIGVLVGGLLCGYVELKAPGKGARVERLKGADREQWLRFRALPNLIYTDGCAWALYRDGSRRGPIVELGEELPDKGSAALDSEAVAALALLLRDFLGWPAIPPGSPKALAEMLAPLCGLLREGVTEALKAPASAISQVAGEWRAALFPEADDRQFADAYAQTLTYALLLARFEGRATVDTDSAQRVLERKHGLLARSLRILGDPQVRAEIGLAVELLERSINAIDLKALGRRAPDPWLYFYEDFLAAYDSKLRNDRGVYYTPAQVIQAQCRLVQQLLCERFGKKLGFADDGVVVLDPSAGTGAYLLAAADAGLRRVAEQQGDGAKAGRASVLARNLHGFELLVGPYAVAHLRVTQAILAAGGELPDDGVHVYLADTLENPYAKELAKLPFSHRLLADEHRRAKRVKAEERVLVCLGNPPYDRQQVDAEEQGPATERKGGWVRYGEHGADAPLNAFIDPARKAGHGLHLKNLYNDYVYFWRWALWKVFEEKKEPAQPAGAGIVSFITAASYLRGPAFVGMREVMRRTFDELWLLDLEGDSLGARKTENVFAIRTPVAIAVGVRYGAPQPGRPAKVRYARIEGTRDAKLERLATLERLEDLEWKTCFEDWQGPLLPRRRGGYFDWPALTDLFPWQHSGVQLKRTWPIGEAPELLRRRWRALVERSSSSPAEKSDRARAFRETPDRRITLEYDPLPPGTQRAPPLSSLAADAEPPPVVRFGHRSLDRKWILADARLGDRMRPPLCAVAGDQQVFLTSLLTEVLGSGSAAMVSAHVPDLHHFRGSFGGKDVIPLWRDARASVANVTDGLLELLSRRWGARIGGADLFAYAYAVMASPRYAERFWDELTIPGPRIPLTSDRLAFQRAARLGRRLIRLHTFGERFSGAATKGIGPGQARCTKAMPTKADQYPEAFEYEPGTKTLQVGTGAFAPVSRRVWEFSVSGFEIARSWLGYRMRDGAGRTSSPLDAIRPERWTSSMTDELLELLWVLEATLGLEPDLERNLDAILASELLDASKLPKPLDRERLPPVVEEAEEPVQTSLAL